MQMFVLFLLCCASGPVSVLVAHVERQPPSAPRDREEYESQFPAQLKADPYVVSAGGLIAEGTSPGGSESADFFFCGFGGFCLRFFGLALGCVACASRAGRVAIGTVRESSDSCLVRLCNCLQLGPVLGLSL